MTKDEGHGAKIAIIIGVLLIIIGILGWVLTGISSITALIPTFFGLPIAILGWAAQTQKFARVCVLIVAILALLGIVGTYTVLFDVEGLLNASNASDISASILSRGAMFILCSIMMIVSMTSFIEIPQNWRKIVIGH